MQIIMLRIFFIIFFTTLSAVDDPYRWLENSDDPRSQEWFKEQKELFNTYNQPTHKHAEIKASLEKLVNHEYFTTPFKYDDNYFFTMRLPTEDQFALYVQTGLSGTPKIILDPNKLSQEGSISLCDFVPSPKGTLVAYGLSENGSDISTWRVLDVSTGKNRTDLLQNMKFTSVAWSEDNLGFYYSRFDTETSNCVYYHTLGTSQDADKLIYQDSEDRGFRFFSFLSSDSRYLLINVLRGAASPSSYLCLDLQSNEITEIVPFDGSYYDFVCNKGTKFYFLTTNKAPLKRLVTIDISHKPCKIEQEIIPESSFLIENVVPVGECFMVSFLENVSSRLALYDGKGNWIKDLPLPDFGSATLSGGDDVEGEIFFSFSNFVRPPTIYRYTLKSDNLEIFKKSSVPVDADAYTIQQIFYPSKDGTSVPMFIVHRKDLNLDGQRPVLLYGYGGFAHICYPKFSCLNMAWLESGGIYVLANIRGGFEFGEEWHKTGMLENKQNCFDDFIAAAEWLIKNGYTVPSKIGIDGVSNGGLLTAACETQRPDLFGAVIAQVGVLDMLRFHLFTVGRYWVPEYGNPEDPHDYAILKSYSPYHNLIPGTHYPATLVVTSHHDDRVVPLHSFKYVAALQKAQGGPGKILLRLDEGVGHGAGKGMSKWIEESTDILYFLHKELKE